MIPIPSFHPTKPAETNGRSITSSLTSDVAATFERFCGRDGRAPVRARPGR